MTTEIPGGNVGHLVRSPWYDAKTEPPEKDGVYLMFDADIGLDSIGYVIRHKGIWKSLDLSSRVMVTYYHEPISVPPFVVPEILYAIGEDDGHGSYDMWAGPTPDVEDLMLNEGKSAVSTIVRMERAPGNPLIAKYAWWDMLREKWRTD